jgi:hypothetical protein
VKTYQILGTGPKDKITFRTRDSAPFLIQANARQAKQLDLAKVPNAKGRDEYQVKKAPKVAIPIKPTRLPAWLKLKCGTLDKSGTYHNWGGVGPDGF